MEKPVCFAVRRGEILGVRFDTDYLHPEFVNLRNNISNLSNTSNVRDLVTEELSTGFAAGKSDQESNAQLGIIQIRPTQILLDGEIDLSDPIRIPLEDCTRGDLIQQSEVLFNNTNSSALVGKSAVFESKLQCVCSNHITRLKLKNGIEPHFIVEVFNCLQRMGYFSRLSTKFNNQAGVNNETLANVIIPFPSKEKRNKMFETLSISRSKFRAKFDKANELLAGLDKPKIVITKLFLMTAIRK